VSVGRLLVVAAILATLVGASSPHSAQPADGDSPVPAAAVAHQCGDDGGAEGDDDDGPIDCSIPDNQDDSGCDTGDVQDGGGAVGDSGDLETRAPAVLTTSFYEAASRPAQAEPPGCGPLRSGHTC
jgi:hypothetical protein